MLEVVARYHGQNKSATIVSLVRKEFWRAFPRGYQTRSGPTVELKYKVNHDS
jgi:hypothetical protein